MLYIRKSTFKKKNFMYLVYNSLMISYVKYCFLCWVRTNKTKINKVYVVINRTIKLGVGNILS